MATFVRTTAINPSELDTKFEEHRLLIGAKAGQDQLDLLTTQLSTTDARAVRQDGTTPFTGIQTGVGGTTQPNQIPTRSDVSSMIAEAINALGGTLPTGTAPTVTTTPVVAVQGGGSAVPGAVLYISTALAWGTNTTDQTGYPVWQADGGTPQNTATGSTYTIGEGDVGKSLSLYCVGKAVTGTFLDISVRSNGIVAQPTPISLQDDRLADFVRNLVTGELTFYGVTGAWKDRSEIVMGAVPHGDACPQWWYNSGGIFIQNWPRTGTTVIVCRGIGDASSNAAVELGGYEFWVLKRDLTWTCIDFGETVAWIDAWPANNVLPDGSAIETTAFLRDGHYISSQPKNYLDHCGSNWVNTPWLSGNNDDVVAVVHSLLFRLVKWDTGGVDDLDSAIFGVQVGADWIPNAADNAALIAAGSYAPGMGKGYPLKATRDWRMATMVHLNRTLLSEYDLLNVVGPPDWKYYAEGTSGGGGNPPAGTDTALDWGGGTASNSSRYATLTAPAAGASWSLGFRFRANKVNDGGLGLLQQVVAGTNPPPSVSAGWKFQINPAGNLTGDLLLTGGTRWTPSLATPLVQNGGNWVFVMTSNGTTTSMYAVPENTTVSGPTASQAMSGSGFPSKTVEIGAQSSALWCVNPIGDFFFSDSAMTDGNVQSFAAGTDASAIVTCSVDLKFRTGGADLQVEDNAGSGGASNDATMHGTGWATTTAFT